MAYLMVISVFQGVFGRARKMRELLYLYCTWEMRREYCILQNHVTYDSGIYSNAQGRYREEDRWPNLWEW